jgi:hypothetical protein
MKKTLLLLFAITSPALASLTLTSVTPPGAVIHQSELITLTGTGFRSDCTVGFKTKSGSTFACENIRVKNTGLIDCSTPAVATVDLADVNVSCSTGNASLPGSFTFSVPLTFDPLPTVEKGLRFPVVFHGGLPPYTITTGYPDAYHPPVGKPIVTDLQKITLTYDESFDQISIKDAIGQTLSQKLPIVPPFADSFSRTARSAPINQEIHLGPPNGLGPYAIHVLNGNSTLVIQSDGQFVFHGAAHQEKSKVLVTDALGFQATFDFRVIEHGYRDSSKPVYLPISRQPMDEFGDRIISLGDIPGTDQAAIARYKLDGSIDTAWGNSDPGQVVDKNENAKGSLRYVTDLPFADGSFLAAGFYTKYGILFFKDHNYPSLRKVLPNGQIDESVNANFDLPNSDNQILALAPRVDGKLWVIVLSNDDIYSTSGEIYAVLLDQNFQQTDRFKIAQDQDIANIVPDGANGFFVPLNSSDPTLIHHFDADGNDDPDFASHAQSISAQLKSCTPFQIIAYAPRLFVTWNCQDGQQRERIGFLLGYSGTPLVAFDASGRLLVAGEWHLRRFLQDGTPDLDFGLDGTASGIENTDNLELFTSSDGMIHLLLDDNHALYQFIP